MASTTSGWDIVVVGGANTDYLVRGPQLPQPGQTVTGAEFQQAPGGKGANQAVAAARLGARVALVTCTGADERGEALVRALDTAGVFAGYLWHDDLLPTGQALIMVAENGEKQIMTTPGANRALGRRDILAAAAAIREARVLLLAADVSTVVLQEAAELAHQAGVRVVLDPAQPDPLPDDLLRHMAVIKPNASEAQAMTGLPVTDRASARRAAEQLLDRGVGAVAIQAGHAGNLLVWADGEHWLPRLNVPSVDATGAGDAFAAGLAVCLAEGQPWPAAGALASAAAALATTVVGAQAGLPERETVEALLQQARDNGEVWVS